MAIHEPTMDHVIRFFNEDDYPAINDLSRFVFPEPWRINRETDAKRDPARPWGRLVAVDRHDETVSGVLHWSQAFGPDNMAFWCAVYPERRRRGIGGALLDRFLEEIAPYGFPFLQTVTFDNLPESHAFLQKRGFTEAIRSCQSRLALSDFEPERFLGVEERLTERGIVIRTFPEIDRTPEVRQRLCDLMNLLWGDVPSPQPYIPLSLAEWEHQNIETSHFLPDGLFVAVDQGSGAFVGVTVLTRQPGSDRLDTGLTGVLPEYRHRGIALALKVRAISHALALGASEIRTGNASTNAAMLAINERLGFRRTVGTIRFLRRFDTTTEDGAVNAPV